MDSSRTGVRARMKPVKLRIGQTTLHLIGASLICKILVTPSDNYKISHKIKFSQVIFYLEVIQPWNIHEFDGLSPEAIIHDFCINIKVMNIVKIDEIMKYQQNLSSG